MKDDDKGTYFQQADWLQYWSTAMLDWQRAYTGAMDGFAQRAEQMTGMRGGPALSPDDFMQMWSRMMENWTGGMGDSHRSESESQTQRDQRPHHITSCSSVSR